jgi:hypothetical protein
MEGTQKHQQYRLFNNVCLVYIYRVYKSFARFAAFPFRWNLAFAFPPLT